MTKGPFGFTKVRYPELQKNAHRHVVACALSNLVDPSKDTFEAPKSGTTGDVCLKHR